MRKTIVHITETLARGGAETLLIGVVQSLVQYEHIIISLRNRNDFAEELKGFKIFYLDLNGYRSLPRLVKNVKKIVSPYNGNAIVHAHMFWANVISRMAVPKTMPLLNSYHSVSYGPNGANYPLHAVLLDKITYQNRITTICVSSAVKENIKKYIGIKNKVHVLYNYINDTFYQDKPVSYKPGSVLKLVSVGNLKLQKNYKYTLEAFGILKKRQRFANCQLDIFGSGPLMPGLKKLAKELELDNINFLGSVPDIANRLHKYDAYLLSSSYEGFGIAVAEAMAAGLPAMVSDIPVLQEITGDKALFFNATKPNELATLIESIVNGKIDLTALSLEGKKQADMYRKNNYMDSLSKIYNDTVSLINE